METNSLASQSRLGSAIKSEVAQTPTRSTQMAINSELATCHEALDGILDKLTPVLKSPRPTPVTAESEPPSTPLHGDLIDTWRGLRALSLQLEELAWRIEV